MPATYDLAEDIGIENSAMADEVVGLYPASQAAAVAGTMQCDLGEGTWRSDD